MISWKKIGLFFLIAVAVQAICVYIESDFIAEFLKAKIVGILITLLAINTATSSLIVSKLQDIGKQYNESFVDTYREVKFSLVEQIFLIALSISILTVLKSSVIAPLLTQKTSYIFDVVLIFNFIYAIDILRDTGVAMFDILIELESDKKKGNN